MDNKKIIEAVVLILKNIDFDNADITERQLLSTRDLLDSILINVTKDKKCEHPKEARRNLTAMGDEFKTEQCLACGEMITSNY